MHTHEAVDLAYRISGPATGLPVLLLHGFPLDLRMWDMQAKALAAMGHRVITPDLRGHGASPRPDVPATMARHAADVRRLADSLALDRFALVGFSLGGYVALEAMRMYPDRIMALGLVDTRAEPDSDEARKGRYATAEDVKQGGMVPLAERMLPKLLTEQTLKQRPELTERVRTMMQEAPPVGMIMGLLGMAERPDARPGLAQIDVPTSVVVGARDALTPPSAAQAMTNAIAQARLHIIADAGHLTPMEAPDAVTNALLGLLEDVTRD